MKLANANAVTFIAKCSCAPACRYMMYYIRIQYHLMVNGSDAHVRERLWAPFPTALTVTPQTIASCKPLRCFSHAFWKALATIGRGVVALNHVVGGMDDGRPFHPRHSSTPRLLHHTGTLLPFPTEQSYSIICT